MANKPDFGYFGKGVSGYVHYKKTVDRIMRSTDSGIPGNKQQHSHCSSQTSDENDQKQKEARRLPLLRVLALPLFLLAIYFPLVTVIAFFTGQLACAIPHIIITVIEVIVVVYLRYKSKTPP